MTKASRRTAAGKPAKGSVGTDMEVRSKSTLQASGVLGRSTQSTDALSLRRILGDPMGSFGETARPTSTSNHLFGSLLAKK